MAIQMQSYDIVQLLKSLPESLYSPSITTNPRASITPPRTSVEHALIKSVIRDDREDLITQVKNLVKSSGKSEPLDRGVLSKLLHLCCEFDSANTALALINGEIGGVVPLINEIDEGSGLSPLHTAAENHSLRCIELLLRKRARTDLKSKAGSGRTSQQLLALEVALHCTRMGVDWGPDGSLNDLLLLLSEKDLSPLKLLAEKTREVGEVAYTVAMEGRVSHLAALMMVAADKVNGSILELRTDTELAAEKTTVYNCVIREAISIYNRVKRVGLELGEKDKERRKLLLREMELLHFFGASPNACCGDKKVASPLILASQAGDEVVLELLLKSDIDVNETDVEGNSALHWSLKANKVPNCDQIRILSRLLNHGAQVRQRNMLGLTAVHIAAGNGNVEALEILLTHDPGSVHATSELRESPLFSAVKNDHIECTQLLLRFGANTDVHNLRRERPIDVAKSQDMRSALNRTSVIITNRASQQKYTAHVHNDEVVSETCEMLLKYVYPTSDSVSSSSDNDICKYYTSPTGCIRGSKCFYKHGEEDSSNPKSRVGFVRSAALVEFKRKVFVGGLPPTMDSESLASILEEHFGPVVDARVLEMDIGGEVVSRGFGFVTFKHEKSVAAAVEAHYINVWGKRVEIKSAVPKCLLSQEVSLDECQQELVQRDNCQLICQASKQSLNIEGEDIPEEMSWAGLVAQGQPAEPVKELKPHRVPPVAGLEMPVWLTTFKKWLPQFLRKMSENSRGGEFYSLSSLKADFKAIFGVELDHASLGYPKLSDFIKSLPGLCSLKVVHTGGQVANHMILLPNVPRPPPLLIPKKGLPVTPVHEQKDESPVSQKFHEDSLPSPCGNIGDTFSKNCFEIKIGCADVNKVNSEMVLGTCTNYSTIVPPHHRRFVQFLEPDPFFLGRTWLGTGGFKEPEEQFRPKHLVLEALARKRKEVFFFRGPNFYTDYAATLKLGNCFACKKNKMLWVSHPCQHLLWCGDCKLIVMRIAAIGTSSHKCVLCDQVVQRIDLITWSQRQQQIHNDFDFPSIHTAYHKGEESKPEGGCYTCIKSAGGNLYESFHFQGCSYLLTSPTFCSKN